MKKYFICVLIVCSLFALSGCSKTCEECNGEGTIICSHCNAGKVICEECDGMGHFDCKKCDGTGYITTNEKCHRCEDSKRPGYICDAAAMLRDLWDKGKLKNEEEYWDVCSSCHGSGLNTVACSKCNGSGVELECSECAGSGEVLCIDCNGSQIITCPICRGEGRVKK